MRQTSAPFYIFAFYIFSLLLPIRNIFRNIEIFGNQEKNTKTSRRPVGAMVVVHRTNRQSV